MNLDYEIWQEDNYGNALPQPDVQPDGSTTATDEQLRRWHSYNSQGIPDRPEGWKMDYKGLYNITGFHGEVLAPPYDSAKEYKELAEKVKKFMFSYQPPVGGHAQINQEWWQREAQKDFK